MLMLLFRIILSLLDFRDARWLYFVVINAHKYDNRVYVMGVL